MQRIQSIQTLRGLAALAVVIFHIFDELKHYTALNVDRMTLRLHVLGNMGVDVFFCISGFVMVVIIHSSEEGQVRSLFLIRRLIRIVPIYWIVTSVMLAAHAAQYAIDRHYRLPTPGVVLDSYLFIPVQNAEGAITPLVSPGWTLTYEMLFYAILFVVIPGSSRRIVVITSSILLLLVAAGALMPLPGICFHVLSSPLLVEFIFGMGTGLITLPIAQPRNTVAFLFLCASALIIGGSHDAVITGDFQRLLLRGVPAGLLVFGILCLNQSLWIWRWMPLLHLGAASYSLYLTQDLVIPVIFRVGFREQLPVALLICVVLTSTVLTAFLCFHFVEKPVLSCLRRWTDRCARAS